jgi:hypothetical protein
VATKLLGVYYTANFTGPDGDMPTWAAVNSISGGGTLTVCDCLYVADSGTQFVITDRESTAGVLYRRTDDTWAEVLTCAEAKTLTGSGYDCYLAWITGYGSTLYVLVDAGHSVWTLYSTDDGETWAQLSQVGGWPYRVGNLLVTDGLALAAINMTGGGGGGYLYYSLNFITWDDSPKIGTSSWRINSHLLPAHRYAHDAYGKLRELLSDYTWNVPAASEDDLLSVGIYGWPQMAGDETTEWLVPTQDGALLKNRIWQSTDAWETKSNPGGLCERTLDLIYCSPYVATNHILGRADSGIVGAYHVIYISSDLGDTIVDRAGGSPATGVDSIPYNCGGICANGIGIVE